MKLDQFRKGKEYEEYCFIIPPKLFETKKILITIELPYSKLNEIVIL